MSRLFLPTAIVADELSIAETVAYGGEWAVYVSHTACRKLAEIEMSASGTGVLTLKTGQSVSSGVRNLALVTTSYLNSAVACQVTIGTTGGGGTMTASFTPPARVADQSFDFPRSYAQDLIPASASDVTAVLTTGLAIVGGSKNTTFEVWQLPDLSTFYTVGCTTDKNFNLKSRTSKGVNCGMTTDRFVKRGMTKPAMLTISQKLASYADGLARVDGGRVTAMLVGIKDGQVTDQRIVFADWIPSMASKLPDADSEAMLDAEEGKYGEAFVYVAP